MGPPPLPLPACCRLLVVLGVVLCSCGAAVAQQLLKGPGEFCTKSTECISARCILCSSTGSSDPQCRNFCDWGPNMNTDRKTWCRNNTDCGNGNVCRGSTDYDGYPWGDAMCAPCVPNGGWVLKAAPQECCSGKVDRSVTPVGLYGLTKCGLRRAFDPCTNNSQCNSGGCANGVCTFRFWCTVAGDCDAADSWCNSGSCLPKFEGGRGCSQDDACLSGKCASSKTCADCKYCTWRDGEDVSKRCSSNADCGAGNVCSGLYNDRFGGKFDYGKCSPCVPDGGNVWLTAGNECCSGRNDGMRGFMGYTKCAPAKLRFNAACTSGSQCNSGTCENGVCTERYWCSVTQDCDAPNKWCLTGGMCTAKFEAGRTCPQDDACLSGKCAASKTCPKCKYCTWRDGDDVSKRCSSNADCGAGNVCSELYRDRFGGKWDYGVCRSCRPEGSMVWLAANLECCSGRNDGVRGFMGYTKCIAAGPAKAPQASGAQGGGHMRSASSRPPQDELPMLPKGAPCEVPGRCLSKECNQGYCT